MDAVEFIKAQNRMCSYYNSCDRCPLEEDGCGITKHPEEAVAKVEEWLKAHSVKTNADKIEELTGTKIEIETHDPAYLIHVTTNGNTESGIAELKRWLESEYMEK